MRLMFIVKVSFIVNLHNIVFHIVFYFELILEIKTDRAATRSESTDRKGKKLSARQPAARLN